MPQIYLQNFRDRTLVLFLKEERTVVHRGVRLLCRAAIEGGRWRAVAFIPIAFIPIGWVPIGVDRLNAFAIHGTGQSLHTHWVGPDRCGPTQRIRDSWNRAEEAPLGLEAHGRAATRFPPPFGIRYAW